MVEELKLENPDGSVVYVVTQAVVQHDGSTLHDAIVGPHSIRVEATGRITDGRGWLQARAEEMCDFIVRNMDFEVDDDFGEWLTVYFADDDGTIAARVEVKAGVEIVRDITCDAIAPTVCDDGGTIHELV